MSHYCVNIWMCVYGHFVGSLLIELLVIFGSACKHNEGQYPNISVESMEGTHGYSDVRERFVRWQPQRPSSLPLTSHPPTTSPPPHTHKPEK